MQVEYLLGEETTPQSVVRRLQLVRSPKGVVLKINDVDVMVFSTDGTVALYGVAFNTTGLQVRYNSFSENMAGMP